MVFRSDAVLLDVLVSCGQVVFSDVAGQCNVLNAVSLAADASIAAGKKPPLNPSSRMLGVLYTCMCQRVWLWTKTCRKYTMD